MKELRWAYGLAAVLILSACDEPIYERKTLASEVHPDRSVTAVIVEEIASQSNGGGIQYLYLLTANQQEWKAPVLEVKGLKGASIGWRGRVLNVSYTSGEVVIAHGLWNDPKAEKGTAAYQVELQLEPHCEDKCF